MGSTRCCHPLLTPSLASLLAHPHNVSSILETVCVPSSQSSHVHSQAAKHSGTLDVMNLPMIQGLVRHD